MERLLAGRYQVVWGCAVRQKSGRWRPVWGQVGKICLTHQCVSNAFTPCRIHTHNLAAQQGWHVGTQLVSGVVRDVVVCPCLAGHLLIVDGGQQALLRAQRDLRRVCAVRWGRQASLLSLGTAKTQGAGYGGQFIKTYHDVSVILQHVSPFILSGGGEERGKGGGEEEGGKRGGRGWGGRGWGGRGWRRWGWGGRGWGGRG